MPPGKTRSVSVSADGRLKIHRINRRGARSAEPKERHGAREGRQGAADCRPVGKHYAAGEPLNPGG
jgi:hypothetical protein